MKRQKPESKLAQRRARTRQRLIEAALELLPKHSFHTLSLDAIAEHVGMTKGAIYGHFPNKHTLIMEALGTLPELRPDRIAWPKGRTGSPRARLRKLGKAVVATLEKASPHASASIELVLHTLTDEEAGQRRRALGAEMRGSIEQRILDLFAPDELSMPPRALALFVSLMVPGLMFARAFEGDAIDDETVLAIFEGLAAK
ncbi:MAG TPA: helix-turn-helix domain-containing protein [Gammaproteobacteria bacterium]|nr:helix-turn-helix domain-containing protein [Gammaproteobacteria bacterium]